MGKEGIEQIAKSIAIEKHQIPNTCLRRSGFAQAGQTTNKSQSTKFEKNFFGHLNLEFGAYLGFVVWDFGHIVLGNGGLKHESED